MFIPSLLASLTLTTSPITENIAEKIWMNECSGVMDNLTHWGKGEEFASFGIGHFIWYSENNKQRFEERFPALLTFLENHGETLPEWLKNHPPCPWNTREEFYEQFQSPRMVALRDFLLKTKQLQALFMTEHLEQEFPQMLAHLDIQEKEKAMQQFHKLAKTPRGMYALVDYLNFKGAGTSSLETYQGKGWGLLQVLLTMSSSDDEVAAFRKAAETILKERVALSPPQRNEQKWLPGWINRIKTY